MSGHLDDWFCADPSEVVGELCDRLRDQTPVALADAGTLLPHAPGLYVFGLGRDHVRYQPLVQRGAGLYIGSTHDLAQRAQTYWRRLVDTDVGDGLVTASVAFGGPLARGWARWAEQVLLASVPTPWNAPGPVYGVGGNVQGGRRASRVPPFWALHPGWTGVTGEVTCDPTAVAGHLEAWIATHAPGLPTLVVA